MTRGIDGAAIAVMGTCALNLRPTGPRGLAATKLLYTSTTGTRCRAFRRIDEVEIRRS